jgi:hypothetical protein
METWLNPIFGSRHYKNFFVLHLERTDTTDIKIIVALLGFMRSVMRGLGAPQLAKIWEVFASLAPSAPRTTKASPAKPPHLCGGGGA